jgi:ferredoxin
MKANVYYFSGTKNTQTIAEMISLTLEAHGYKVHKQSIEDCNSVDSNSVDSSDLLVIGGPIYAGNMPEKLIQWVQKNIPESAGKSALVFSSSAGLRNPHGVVSIGKKLSEKGYDVIGLLPYEMPRNFYFGSYEPTKRETAVNQVRALTVKINEDLSKCLSGKPIHLVDTVVKIDLMAKTMALMSKFMGKNFKVTDACIQCGLCVRSCPTSNITMTEKPQFHFSCMMCTRCIHNCPVHAITYKNIHYPQYKIPLID